MLSMPFAAARSSGSLRSRALGLLAALVMALTPALALADTGEPSPQGYTGDVADGAQAQDGGDPANEYADNDPSALTDFRDTLDPYGTWTQDPTYGTIWVPDSNEVGADFAPYQTAGHWAVADSGEWMWVSDYDWGYIPFHYGRWVWAGSYWGWIPGRVYAPAWVTWRVGDDGYIGWAPLPPSWYWANGVAVGLWTIPYAAYCFVPTSYVFYNNVSTYVVRDRGVVQRAAAGTRPYTPANPSVGQRGSHNPRRRSPSFSAARIPASAVPQRRVSPDARAMGFSNRTATAAIRRSALAAPGRTSLHNVAPQANRPSAWHKSYDGYGRSVSPAAPPRFHGTPAGRAAPPRFHGTPAGRAAPPRFHGTPGARSATPTLHSVPRPSFRSPSSFHRAPAARAPSVTHAAPLSRPAAPRFSGGGGRGGGGRRR